jgi:hypothetical protein
MRAVICLLIMLSVAPGVLHAQLSLAHKSEGQIAGMTPEQRVEEYVKEYARHYYDEHYDYLKLLTKYIYRDGPKALPAIAKVMGEYDPAAIKKWDERKAKRHQAAHALLSEIDGKVFRIRAFSDGKNVIEAAKRAQERIEKSSNTRENDLGENIDDLRGLHKLVANFTKQLEGLSLLDHWIKDTLWFRYDIELPEADLLGFINFLITRDPHYPSWARTETYNPAVHGFKKGVKSHRNLFGILKNPEPIFQLYQEYKAKQKQ